MRQEKTNKQEVLPEIEDLKVYKLRWLILGIFVIYSASNALPWVQYSIISNIIVKYYGVSTIWIDWTSMIYLILYIPFIFPGSYLLDKFGLRVTVLTGMMGTCLGSWIKVGSVAPDRFWVGFLGQSLVALSQIFVLSVPTKLAAVWFGPSQVSTACSIGVFGNQLGIALGFILPSLLVKGDGTQEEITRNLYVMFIGIGIFNSLLLIVIVFLFKNKPPTPPSHAQNEPQELMKSLKRLFCSRSYLLLLTSYGINVGIFYAISTLLNPIILLYYPQGEEDAGRIGLLMVVAGLLGSVLCGVILDKFHKFKETTLVIYGLILVGMVVFTFTLSDGIEIVYLTVTLLGFFQTSLLPVGFEFAVELTYPEPEGTTAGLLNASAAIFGIIFINSYSAIFNNLNDIWANSVMCVMLLLGTIATGLIKSNLKRQAAHSIK